MCSNYLLSVYILSDQQVLPGSLARIPFPSVIAAPQCCRGIATVVPRSKPFDAPLSLGTVSC